MSDDTQDTLRALFFLADSVYRFTYMGFDWHSAEVTRLISAMRYLINTIPPSDLRGVLLGALLMQENEI